MLIYLLKFATKVLFLFLCQKQNMITIYHNPRCTKSRECLSELENLNQSVEIRRYLEEPFSETELKEVIKKLKIKPLELVRTKEAIWIEKFKGKTLSDDEIIKAMLEHPKIIERPIVLNGANAIIARPKEKIKEIL
jgi:arsenate reductase (glutaredoxin)